MKFLRFLNLLDRSGKLSITNLALLVLLMKIAVMPAITLADASAFFIVLLNYGHKRMETNKAVAKESEQANSVLAEELRAKVDEVESKVSALSLQTGIRSLGKQ